MGQTTSADGILSRLKNRHPIVLDGAMGTELERRGYATQLPLWSASAIELAPDLIMDIHRDYLGSGANILTANTFRATRHTFQKTGQTDKSTSLAKKAVALALEAIDRSESDAIVAGSIAPLEDCYSPHLVPSRDTIEREYAHQFGNLLDAGCHVILAETMINISEVRVLSELLGQGHLPWMLSFTVDSDGKLLDGTLLEDAIESCTDHSPTALLLNCRQPDVLTTQLQKLSASDLPFGAYGNGMGSPGGETGWLWEQDGESDEAYVSEVKRWREIGATIIGGCCGTTPSTIAAVQRAMAE